VFSTATARSSLPSRLAHRQELLTYPSSGRQGAGLRADHGSDWRRSGRRLGDCAWQRVIEHGGARKSVPGAQKFLKFSTSASRFMTASPWARPLLSPKPLLCPEPLRCSKVGTRFSIRFTTYSWLMLGRRASSRDGYVLVVHLGRSQGTRRTMPGLRPIDNTATCPTSASQVQLSTHGSAVAAEVSVGCTDRADPPATRGRGPRSGKATCCDSSPARGRGAGDRSSRRPRDGECRLTAPHASTSPAVRVERR